MKFNKFYVFCLLALLISILVTLMFMNCSGKEGFTVPSLTLTKAPTWFPENSAKHYNKKDWEEKMYLERYPFKNKSYEESNELASAYRFWRN